MNSKADLYSMTPEELSEYLQSIGEASYRAKQIFPALHGGIEIENMTTLSKKLRDRLRSETLDTLPKV